MKERVQSFAFHLAITILDADVALSEHVKTIGLPEADSDFKGQIATLVGPGWLRDGGPYPKELMMKVSLKMGGHRDRRKVFWV